MAIKSEVVADSAHCMWQIQTVPETSSCTETMHLSWTILETAFTALLWRCWLAGRKGIRPVNMGDKVLGWLSVWREVQMICIWSSWCHCHLVISCSSKIQNGLPFWRRLTHVVLEKRPLNGCSSSSCTILESQQVIWWNVANVSYSMSLQNHWEWPSGISPEISKLVSFGYCATSTEWSYIQPCW